MSNTQKMPGARYQLKLLSSVSALALLGWAYAGSKADAAQSDERPPLWFDLGWQFEGVSGAPQPFMPPFTSDFALVGAPSADIAQKVMAYSYGAESSITFQPDGSDWVFSAAVRYGRAHGRKQAGVQTNTPPQTFHTTGRFGQYPSTKPRKKFIGAYKSGKVSASNSETHVIADFQAGRDVGLGAFGSGSSSVVSAGVRFAQINAKAAANLAALPNINFAFSFYAPTWHKTVHYGTEWHDYAGSSHNRMSFRGIGPSISWKASAAIAGNLQNGELNLDWGANAALLFGRQKSAGQHQATGRYHGYGHYHNTAFYGPSPVSHDRSRGVTVPDVGGFAGVSLQWNSAKVSLGYRADFFFNALDTGIDARHDTTRGYYGPFASISIGLGGSDN